MGGFQIPPLPSLDPPLMIAQLYSVSCFLSCKNSCENVRGLKNISIRVDIAWFTINDERQFVPLNQDFSYSCVAGAWKQSRLEAVGTRKNGRARRRHACLLAPARSLFRPLLPSACYAGQISLVVSVFIISTQKQNILCQVHRVQSERFLILVFLWYKATDFRGITADLELPPLILSGAYWPGNWTPFDSNIVSVSDERGSVINDYLQSVRMILDSCIRGLIS